MQLLCVNIGKAQPINAKSGESGIYKRSQREPVAITYDGLAGDTIVDSENHGGPDQAVYAYGWPDYEWWADQLGGDLGAGMFGENLTIAGDPVRLIPYAGDRLSLAEYAAMFFAGKSSPAETRRIQALPVAIRDRAYYEAMLAEIGG